MLLSNLGVHAERFKREHSQVGVHLVVENTRRCCQAVSRGELDFAVVGGKIPADLQHLLLVSSILLLHPSVHARYKLPAFLFTICMPSALQFTVHLRCYG